MHQTRANVVPQGASLRKHKFLRLVAVTRVLALRAAVSAQGARRSKKKRDENPVQVVSAQYYYNQIPIKDSTPMPNQSATNIPTRMDLDVNS